MSIARDTNIPQAVICDVEQTFSSFCRTLAFPTSVVPISRQQWNLIATAVIVALGHKRLVAGYVSNENSADMQVRLTTLGLGVPHVREPLGLAALLMMYW